MPADLPNRPDKAPTSGEQTILPPYMPSDDTPRRRRQRLLIVILTALYCLFQGFAFAIFGQFLLVLFLVPLALLMGLVIWALPEARSAPTRTMEFLFFAFFTVYVIWPDYLALALPGLPWITLNRLTSFPMVFLLLVSYSQSSDFRQTLKSVVSAAPTIWKFVLAFAFVQLLSIIFSINRGESVQKFVISQVALMGVFFVSAYVFSKPNRAERWCQIVWSMVMFTGLLSIPEYRAGHVVWAGHIPSFFKIEDPAVQAILAGGGRRYTNIYRVQSTFSTSLGFGEFLAMASPIVLQFTTRAHRPAIRWAAALTMPFILYVDLLTGSRSGLLGLIIAVMLWVLVRGAIAWNSSRSSLIGPAVVLAFPATGALVLAATLFVGRIHRAVWGGGETESSTEGRVLQWRQGWPKIFHNPFGYGVGEGANELGFYEANGLLTIDSEYLNGILQYGVIGFGVFVALILSGAFHALKTPLLDEDGKATSGILCAMAISLIVFIFICSVFAEEGIFSFVFLTLGLITGVLHRVHASTGVESVEGGLVRP